MRSPLNGGFSPLPNHTRPCRTASRLRLARRTAANLRSVKTIPPSLSRPLSDLRALCLRQGRSSRLTALLAAHAPALYRNGVFGGHRRLASSAWLQTVTALSIALN